VVEIGNLLSKFEATKSMELYQFFFINIFQLLNNDSTVLPLKVFKIS